MLRFHEIRELIRLFDRSSLTELELKNDGFELELKKEPTRVDEVAVQQQGAEVSAISSLQEKSPETSESSSVLQAQGGLELPLDSAEELDEGQQGEAGLHPIVSPMVGTFYAAPSPESEPYVQIGSKVSEESVVCIVEAMKLFNEIEAEVSGEIVQILVENGQLVEYGQPLFMVRTK